MFTVKKLKKSYIIFTFAYAIKISLTHNYSESKDGELKHITELVFGTSEKWHRFVQNERTGVPYEVDSVH